jgi:hypothetical protein
MRQQVLPRIQKISLTFYNLHILSRVHKHRLWLLALVGGKSYVKPLTDTWILLHFYNNHWVAIFSYFIQVVKLNGCHIKCIFYILELCFHIMIAWCIQRFANNERAVEIPRLRRWAEIVRLPESWENKIWSLVRWESETRIIVLARTTKFYQTRPPRK